MSQLDKEIEEILEQTQVRLLVLKNQNAAFLTGILSQLKIVITKEDDHRILTAATDGINLFFNPKFLKSLTKDEAVFLLAHELLHVAFNHMGRIEHRDHHIWNAACDYVINDILKKQNYTFIKSGLHDPMYSGWSSEQVYDYLVQNPDKVPQQMDLDVLPMPEGMSEEDFIQATAKILKKAETVSKLSGDESLPEEITQVIKQLTVSSIPWNVILRNFMFGTKKDDYSLARPNRRYMPDYYISSLTDVPDIGDIVFAIDTSGSMSNKDIELLNEEVAWVHSNLRPNKTTIISFDTKVNTEQSFYEGNPINQLTFSGRGGTDLRAPFKYLKDKRRPVEFLVVISDLYDDPVIEKSPYPVIWVCLNNPKATVHFGNLIHVIK